MNKSLIVICMTGCFLASLASSTVAQNQNNSRFDITLNEQWESKLKSLGTLQSTVRGDSRGKIAAIQIEFAETQDQPHVEMNVPFTIAGDACQLTLSDAIIEAAKKQPVRIPTPDNSPFSQVFLNYSSVAETMPANSTVAGSASRNTGIGVNGSGSSNAISNIAADGIGAKVDEASETESGNSVPFHFVKLSAGKVIVGQMDLTEKLSFETKFGEVGISLGQIAGIRFHIDGDDSAVVVLNNGDSVTGIPKSDSLNLTTDWGRAEFDPVYVEQITTRQNASFSPTNDPQFGQRWILNNR